MPITSDPCGLGGPLEFGMIPNEPFVETRITIECGEYIDASDYVAGCAFVSAQNQTVQGGVSDVTERSYPDVDCIPVSEPSMASGIAASLIALAVLHRIRR
jgi:hypothetical protein